MVQLCVLWTGALGSTLFTEPSWEEASPMLQDLEQPTEDVDTLESLLSPSYDEPERVTKGVKHKILDKVHQVVIAKDEENEQRAAGFAQMNGGGGGGGNSCQSDTDTECNQDAKCYWKDSECHACHVLSQNECSDNVMCYWKTNNTCRAKRDVGQSCNNSKPCQEGLECNGTPKTCKRPCQSDTDIECHQDARCYWQGSECHTCQGETEDECEHVMCYWKTNDNECRAKITEGNTCNNNKPCQEGLECNGDPKTCVRQYRITLKAENECPIGSETVTNKSECERYGERLDTTFEDKQNTDCPFELDPAFLQYVCYIKRNDEVHFGNCHGNNAKLICQLDETFNCSKHDGETNCNGDNSDSCEWKDGSCEAKPNLGEDCDTAENQSCLQIPYPLACDEGTGKCRHQLAREGQECDLSGNRCCLPGLECEDNNQGTKKKCNYHCDGRLSEDKNFCCDSSCEQCGKGCPEEDDPCCDKDTLKENQCGLDIRTECKIPRR